jgi:hypothetical protein
MMSNVVSHSSPFDTNLLSVPSTKTKSGAILIPNTRNGTLLSKIKDQLINEEKATVKATI